MPIPKPTPTQSKQAFLSSCMADEVMVADFPDEAQRYAVCIGAWDGDRGAKTLTVDGWPIVPMG